MHQVLIQKLDRGQMYEKWYSFVENWLDETFSVFGLVGHFVHHVTEQEHHEHIANVVYKFAKGEKNELIEVQSRLCFVITSHPDEKTKLIQSNEKKVEAENADM